MTASVRLSVVIPVHNEADSLVELFERLRAVDLRGHGELAEILVVDDGSTDETATILKREREDDERIRVLSLSRNFGHQAALTAGLDHVSGEAVVVMDGDLQDAPEDIPRFLKHYREGFDVVYAVRVGRKEGRFLRACYRLFYRVIAGLSELDLPLGAGDFGLMDRRVVKELRQTRETHRYLRGLRTWVGFRQVGVEVERRVRGAGRSKYGLKGLLRLAFDGIFAFSTVPIRISALIGLVAILLAAGFGTYSLVVKLLLDRSPQGFTALILVIVFMSGVQLLFLGVIGEYIGRVYDEVKQRPLYVIESRLGFRTSHAEDRPDGASHGGSRY